MKYKLGFALLFAVGLSLASWGDTLELKNGSLIKGRYAGGTETEVTFQVGSSVQKYNVADIVSLKFDSDRPVSERHDRGRGNGSGNGNDWRSGDRERPVSAASTVTIPVGTRIAVRTIDGIDSEKNHVGDKFQASLEEPLIVNGNVVAAKGADVYGRLAESKESGTFAGKSQLRLELTGIVMNGRTVPIVTGEYELTGKSKGASTAKRTVGGAAVGSLIGALAGGGKGAAVGAAVGGGVGAGSEVITKGDQVKIPSETLLDFTLQQEVSVPAS